MMNEKELNAIIEKSREKIAVVQFKKESLTIPKRNMSKMVASIILVIALSAGGVYAGAITYNKIWKEPKAYTTHKLTEEEIAACISKEEAEAIGNSYLKKIGFTEENIKGLGLEKDFYDNENIWRMWSSKATIEIDGKTGDIKYIQIPSYNYKIPYNYGINRIEARKVARELLEKYRPEDDKGEYELVTLRRNMETDEASYIWYAEFHKKYGDLLNKYEKIFIGWIPTINGLYSLKIERNIYENNEENISKEEAIRIAVDKDKEIEKEKNIVNVVAEIRIEQMNEQVYLRENYKEKYENLEFRRYKEGEIYYKTEGIVRKVWVVVIEYEGVYSFTYFVDSTTGEIIGGTEYDSLLRERQIRDEQYNLIEK